LGDILSKTVTDSQYSEAHTYGYDEIYRLTSAAVTSGPANYSEGYTYNATSGNLQTKGGLTLAYNDPNHVHVVSVAGGKSSSHCWDDYRPSRLAA
jgi:hypothetical protein